MIMRFFLVAFCVAALQPALAKVARDPGATLGRDLAVKPGVPDAAGAALPAPPPNAASAVAEGLFVGAMLIEGGREIAPQIFAPIIESYVGKSADGRGLQAMARAVATAAREEGYIFASAVIPEQRIDTGTVTIRLDLGAVDRVRLTGSTNARLQQVLEAIVGPAVRKTVLERQLLLAADVPGITIIRTNYVREAGGATLIVEVSEDKVSGSAALDNYGSQSLGPARLRLRLDLPGLLGDDDRLTVQALATPLEPEELSYGSLRYTIGLGAATRAGVVAALGRTERGSQPPATGESLYGAVFLNHAVLRSTRASLWGNVELDYLQVDRSDARVRTRRDAIATLTLSTTATARLAGGRLWGGLSAVRGLGFAGTTRLGDAQASRDDASGVFTKAMFWTDYTRTLGSGFSVRLAASGQLADRPLLSAQELGVGGPGFGRGYDFSETFGDQGVLGLVEIRERFDKLMPGVDWVQFYQFVDGGYAANLADGFGDGARISAGGGLRAQLGKLRIGVELGFPVNARREDANSLGPRVNLNVERDF